MKQQVAVLGAGAVCNVGLGLEALVEGSAQPEANGSSYTGFEVSDYVPLQTQCLDTASAVALVAAALALKDAGIRVEDKDDERFGLVLGTAFGNARVLSDYAAAVRRGPLRFVHSFINTPAGLVSQVLKVQGPHALLCSGPSAGMQAIRYAAWLLSDGKADVVICGGVDSWTGGDKEKAGAGVLALSAVRQMEPEVRLTYGVASKGTADGLQEALRGAAMRSGCMPSDVDLVVLGTPPGTKRTFDERDALERVGVDARRWTDLGSIQVSGAGHVALAAVLAYAHASSAGNGSNSYRTAVTAVFEDQSVCVILERAAQA